MKTQTFETPLAEVLYLQAELDKNYWKAGEGITPELLKERAELMAALAEAENTLVSA
jgi:hypothetical protein